MSCVLLCFICSPCAHGPVSSFIATTFCATQILRTLVHEFRDRQKLTHHTSVMDYINQTPRPLAHVENRKCVLQSVLGIFTKRPPCVKSTACASNGYRWHLLSLPSLFTRGRRHNVACLQNKRSCGFAKFARMPKLLPIYGIGKGAPPNSTILRKSTAPQIH